MTNKQIKSHFRKTIISINFSKTQFPFQLTNPINTPTPITVSSPAKPLRKFIRSHNFPSYLQDYFCKSVIHKPSLGNPYPISVCLSYSKLSPSYTSYLMTITITKEA